jgi:hypothetical protein
MDGLTVLRAAVSFYESESVTQREGAAQACPWRQRQEKGLHNRFLIESKAKAYLPRVARRVSTMAAIRKMKTKYVATRLAELSSRISDIRSSLDLLELEPFPDSFHGRDYDITGIVQARGEKRVQPVRRGFAQK